MTRPGGWARVLALSMAVFAVDRVTKLVASAVLQPGQSVPVVPDIFHLTLVLNRGAAFGFLKDQRVFFISISILAIVLIIYYLSKHAVTALSVSLAFGLIMGGALGNLLDRIKFGYVVDFLDFRVWPVFNVADSAISVGAGLLIICMLSARRTDAAARHPHDT